VLAIKTRGLNGTSVASTTTSCSAASVSGTASLTTAVAGITYTLTDAAAGGANLGQYTGSVSCTNSTSGGTNVSSVGLGTVFTPVAGDVMNYTITNTPKPATHWDGDFIKGAGNQSSAGVLVERSSRLVLLVKKEDATAASLPACFEAILERAQRASSQINQPSVALGS
jgi:hypothetical protein